jgi:hypothetical protein
LSAVEAAGMPNIQPTKEEKHVEMLLQRVRVANEHGKVKELRYWAGAYLNSIDAKLAAVQTANRRRKYSDRFDAVTVQKIAAGLDAWKGTVEAVLVYLEKKDSTPVSFRTYMAFGIENKALQYLVLRLLEQVADIAPYQYTVKGGTHAAIKHVANVMSTGPVWAVEIDVIDCYSSVDGKKLRTCFPPYRRR